jgi:hypothetical protein
MPSTNESKTTAKAVAKVTNADVEILSGSACAVGAKAVVFHPRLKVNAVVTKALYRVSRCVSFSQARNGLRHPLTKTLDRIDHLPSVLSAAAVP